MMLITCYLITVFSSLLLNNDIDWLCKQWSVDWSMIYYQQCHQSRPVSGEVSRNTPVRSSPAPGWIPPSDGRWRLRCIPGGSPGPCERGSGGRQTHQYRTRQHSRSGCLPWNIGRTAGSEEDLQEHNQVMSQVNIFLPDLLDFFA